MITKEQGEQLEKLRNTIHAETGIKVEIDTERGRLMGFKAKPQEIEQVKKIIADVLGRPGPDTYSFRYWESKDRNRDITKQEAIDKEHQPELDLDRE